MVSLHDKKVLCICNNTNYLYTYILKSNFYRILQYGSLIRKEQLVLRNKAQPYKIFFFKSLGISAVYFEYQGEKIFGRYQYQTVSSYISSQISTVIIDSDINHIFISVHQL